MRVGRRSGVMIVRHQCSFFLCSETRTWSVRRHCYRYLIQVNYNSKLEGTHRVRTLAVLLLGCLP